MNKSYETTTETVSSKPENFSNKSDGEIITDLRMNKLNKIKSLAALKIQKFFWGRIIPEVVSGINDFSSGDIEGRPQLPVINLVKSKLARAISNRTNAYSYILSQLVKGKNLAEIAAESQAKLDELSAKREAEKAEGKERDVQSFRYFNSVLAVKIFTDITLQYLDKVTVIEEVAIGEVLTNIQIVGNQVFNMIASVGEEMKISQFQASIETKAKNINRDFMGGVSSLNAVLEIMGEQKISFF